MSQPISQLTSRIESAAVGLLILRCGPAKRPEFYHRWIRSQLPFTELLSQRPTLASGWPALARNIFDVRQFANARKEVEHQERSGVSCIAACDPEYPASLMKIYDPPPLLFVRGTLPQTFFGLAVVGSRSADSNAFRISKSIAEEAVRRTATVVSGLALGIDSAAHRGSLERNDAVCPTIAVLGTGIDQTYPRANIDLAEDIVARGGALISQFDPKARVYPSNFIARNQIIAGLSRGVVVVQGAKSSGSLATARFAMEEGRDVFVLPGMFGDVRYEGSHRLLRDGAILVTEMEDIFGQYPELEKNTVKTGNDCTSNMSEIEQKIFAFVKHNSGCSFQQLAAEMASESDKIEEALLQLELSGHLNRLPGNHLQLAHLN